MRIEVIEVLQVLPEAAKFENIRSGVIITSSRLWEAEEVFIFIEVKQEVKDSFFVYVNDSSVLVLRSLPDGEQASTPTFRPLKFIDTPNDSCDVSSKYDRNILNAP